VNIPGEYIDELIEKQKYDKTERINENWIYLITQVPKESF